MANKKSGSKTILIIVAIILGILIIGGIVVGISFYYLYKARTQSSGSPQTTTTTPASAATLPYENARFGFSLKYPETFTAQQSQNGDGVTLSTNDPKMTIRAYGSNNVLSQDLSGYLNEIRDNLFQEAEDPENAKEILAEDIVLGGLPAKERQWTYVDSKNGTLTFIDQVTALNGDTFYNLQMEIASLSNDEYSAHVFDNILSSYRIK